MSSTTSNGNFSNFWNSNSSSPLFFEGENNKEPRVLNSSVPVRMAFLRKVYGILSVQLALTTIISGSIMFMPSLQGFIYRNQWILIFNMLANIVSVFALLYKRTEYPTNFYLLGAFTAFQSFTLGILISQYDLLIVSQAFFLTAAIVVGLTMYTLQSKRDFQWLGGVLYSFMLVISIGSLLHIFFRNSVLETLLSIAGAFMFSAYIIYDTQMIMKHLSAEEYILGVINLYMDIINLFIKILRILDAIKSSQEKKSEKNKRK